MDKINNTSEYARALERLGTLMAKSINPNSHEWEELVRLSKIVEKYENANMVYTDIHERNEKAPSISLSSKIFRPIPKRKP